MKIGFPGGEGSHSQFAIKDFFRHIGQPHTAKHPLFSQPTGQPKWDAHAFNSELDALEGLMTGEVDFVALPIENTNSGTFTENYDLLIRYNQRAFVVAEHILTQENALMVPGDDGATIDLASITAVYSHHHVLEQSQAQLNIVDQARLKAKKPVLDTFAMRDTALACKHVASLHDTSSSPQSRIAVLAHPEAAAIYSLKVVERVSTSVSATRYFILALQPLTHEQLNKSQIATTNKTSLAIKLQNSPGMLFKSLSCFAFRDINVSKLETRPANAVVSAPNRGGNVSSLSSKNWMYINYIDVEGGTNQQSVRNAMANLQEFVGSVYVLGSYPRF